MKMSVLIVILLILSCILYSFPSESEMNKMVNNSLEDETDTIPDKWIYDSLSDSEILIEYLKNYSHNYIPDRGYIPDSNTAISIAISILAPIYGKEIIDSEYPFHAVLVKDSVWLVYGSLPEGYTGGFAIIELAKKDCRVLRVTHGK